MKNILIRILQGLVLIVVASSFAHADNFMYFKKKAATGGGGTINYCADANAQLCLFMNGDNTAETDRTANAYTFTRTGSLPISATVPSGYAGKSRSFSYTNDTALSCAEASCPNLGISGASAKITMTAWVRVSSAATGSGQYVIDKGLSSNNTRSYQITISPIATNQFKFSCSLSENGTTANTVVSTDNTYVTNTWYQFACVSDDTDIRVYVNGVLSSTPLAYTNGIYNDSNTISIGRGPASGTANFNGLIDEVAIFNRALSSAEVLGIYTNGISGNKGGSD